ncbi:hypothetical protein SRH_00230 [Mesomycoplasma hyorhinis MCLD]|uniref:Uncharacterized protein n=1 Tax=Mesomycoplasma hyorhinis (strain MCLD) TaxID=936139 RepID=A0ABM5M4R1_MESHM|nr:hypothetical protein SRH_00230 [Mesomycoplasma hyorhinis MCLD]
MIQLKLFFQITIPIRFHSIFFTPQLPGQKKIKNLLTFKNRLEDTVFA